MPISNGGRVIARCGMSAVVQQVVGLGLLHRLVRIEGIDEPIGINGVHAARRA